VGPERPEEVLFLETVRRGENVRFRGEDVKKNDLLAAPGQRLNAARLSLLAAAGVTTVHCFRRPVIGLLATGNELREPGARLEAGAIFESNRIGLAALARQMGAQPKSYPLVGDSVEKIQAALKQAFLECDIVATSGGASVGEMDLVRSAFCGLGGQLDFWKVAMRPGKPLAFGALEGKCLAALPGNPVSALVTFFLFVCPALLRLQGDSQARLPVQKAALGQALKNDSERRHFMQVIIDSEGAVRPLARQASHRLKPAAEAVGLVEVPPLATLEAGTLVSVLGWGL
jgi:molybdopterin molybdotransferase